MKRYAIYPTLLLWAVIIVFTACEDDPVIPKTNFRNIDSPVEITKIPDLLIGYDLLSSFRFTISNDIYISGKYESSRNAEDMPYDGRVLYKWNTEEKQWKVAWYLTQKEIEEAGSIDYEEANLLREAGNMLTGDSQYNGCSFNGKGYVYANKIMVEFDPSASQIKYYRSDEYLDFSNNIFSTTKGVFGIANNEIYQYSITGHQWEHIGYISYTYNGYNNNGFSFFTQGPDIYTWEMINGSQFKIATFAYPYANMQETYIEFPRDYGWESYNYNNMSNWYDAPFCIDGKLYKRNNMNSYYEYDLKSQSLTVVLFKYEEHIEMKPIYLISNKLYYFNQNQNSIMEIAF